MDKGTQGWTSRDGMIAWKDRIYVPKDAPLREEIIRLHHDSTLAGHPGRYKTHELITRNYWWPGIHRDIRKYVEGCEECQRAKPIRQSPHNPLHPHDVPSEPWQVISVDLIGELPESQGYNAICVVVDRFSKQIHVVPTRPRSRRTAWPRFTGTRCSGCMAFQGRSSTTEGHSSSPNS